MKNKIANCDSRRRTPCTVALVTLFTLLTAGCSGGETDDDPLGHCPISENAEAREPDLVGNCSYAEPRHVVLDAFENLGDDGILCEDVVNELEALMAANPDQHVALAVYSTAESCGVSSEAAAGYETESGFLATYIVRDLSRGCESRCYSLGATWVGFLVEPDVEVEFCGAVVGGCEQVAF